MNFYSRLESTAKRLITQFGKTGYLVVDNISGPDHDPVIGVQDRHECSFVEIKATFVNRDRSNVQQGDIEGIMSTSVAIAPELSHRIEVNGSEHKILSIDPINPGGVVLMYEFHARR